jgi:hypothetical protein
METARNRAMDSVAIVEQQNQKASSSLETDCSLSGCYGLLEGGLFVT